MSKKHHRHRPAKKRPGSGMSAHAGEAPGSLIIDPESPRPVIHVFAYGPSDYIECDVADPAMIPAFLEKWPVTWINVDGLGDADTLKSLAIMFNLHRLAVEDVTSTYQRPKVEAYDDQLFIIVRQPAPAPHFDTEQLNIFLGRNYVLTFQDRPGDRLERIRDHIRRKLGRIRNEEADYLAYSLIDAVIDAYFPILEEYGTNLEALEDEVIDNPTTETVSQILFVKRNLLGLRRVTWPLREMLNTVLRDVSANFRPSTQMHLRDCYDHVVHILDMVEIERELVSSLLDVYISSLSNKMNDVMRVLTIISTVFIPLSFIAGYFGMNFDHSTSPFNMPELHWYYGYPVAVFLMFALSFAMVYFFWRKGWLHSLRIHTQTATDSNHIAPQSEKKR